jgi:hypothetical protein
MPDPIDQAYAEAETMLSDGAARAARRAKVLAAVADQAAAPSPAARPRLWRPGGWLVAACVSGLALIVATLVYRPSLIPPPSRPVAVAEPAAAPVATTAGPAQAPPVNVSPALTAAPVQARPSAPKAVSRLEALPAAEKAVAEAPPVVVAQAPVPPAAARPEAAAANLAPAPLLAPPPAPPPPEAPSQRAAADTSPQPAPIGATADDQTEVTEMVVTSQKRQARRASAPVAISAFAGRQRDLIDAGARLRSAAAAGLTTDVQILLDRGAPVDAADASGETALMKSVQSNHPAAAALLRRHGASLDQTNDAGESAADMAKSRDDPRLDKALGLKP